MPVNVTWYGERGIVNAVATGLLKAGVPGVISFLEQVEWGGVPPHLDKITSVELIVEIGCGQFGDPDLIIICKSGEKVLFVCVIEAKIISYEVSAGPNHRGMREKGYNSTINGQLSLKYRLAMALSQWSDPYDELRESEEIYNAYKRPWVRRGLADINTNARHLMKPTVLNILGNAGLTGLALEQFRFVALTWDNEAFFVRDDFHNSDYRPLFLDQNGNEQWENTLSQLGWIGFQQIARLASFEEGLGEEFRRAFKTMRNTLEPEPIGQAARNDKPPLISPYNIATYSHRGTIEQLQNLEKLAEQYFTVKREQGSSSIKYAGKVMLKLVPRNHSQNEYLLLGVSTTLGLEEWGRHILVGPQRIGVANNAQSFYTIDLPVTDEATGIATEIFQDVATVLGLSAVGE